MNIFVPAFVIVPIIVVGATFVVWVMCQPVTKR